MEMLRISPYQPDPGRVRYLFAMDSDEVGAEPLQAKAVGDILDDNLKRISALTSMSRFGLDPISRAVVSYFEQVIIDRGCGVDTKLSRLDTRFRSVLRGYIEARSRLAGSGLDMAGIDGLVDGIIASMDAGLASAGVSRPVSSDIEFDPELYDMVKEAIDDASLDKGGINRTELRVQIGRNHVSYIRQIDDIISRLLESGAYGMNEGRLVAIMHDTSYTERIPHRIGSKRGRPRKDAGQEIVRHIDGKITDFIPVIKKEKESENDE